MAMMNRDHSWIVEQLVEISDYCELEGLEAVTDALLPLIAELAPMTRHRAGPPAEILPFRPRMH
ncbi:MAG: hypothetical protein IE922_07495 [Sphingomonadales bacterium]|nr:hypothetical protein [Sphingomonadales bacterium]